MNRRTVFLVSISAFITLLMLAAVALAGFGDMTSPNYAIHGGFVGAVGGQITTTNAIAVESRVEPFGGLGWADGLPGQWLPPELPFPGEGIAPVAAFDGAGVLHAAWVEDGGIHYAARPEGGTWPTATLVPDSTSAEALDLAVGPGGDVHLAWLEGTAIRYALKLAGGEWPTTAGTLPTDAGDSRAPRLAVDAGGTVHLVWYDAAADQFRYNHKPRGGAWRDNLLHDGNPVPPGDIPDPGYASASAAFDLALDPAGTLHLVWCDGESCYHGQKTSYKWAVTAALLDSGINLAAPDLAIDREGQLHAVWASQRITTTGGGITYCAFDGAACTTTQSWAADHDTDAPSIAVDATGDAHVVWHEGAPNGELYYPRPDGAGGWDDPACLVFNAIGSHDPALALGPSGALHLLWSVDSTGIRYAHTDPAPWHVTPNEIMAGTAPTITISGRGFSGPTTVSMNGETVSGTVVNSTTLAFTPPTTLPGGWHDLALTRFDGATNVVPDGLWINDPPDALLIEEVVPTPYRAAFDVSIDPNGNVWTIEGYSGVVPEDGTSPAKLWYVPYDRYSRSYLQAEWIFPNSLQPTVVVADFLGYIWLYEPADNQIIQLDPISDPGNIAIAATFDVPTADAGVQAMAVDPATNNIWFVESNVGKLGYIDVTAGTITDTIHTYDGGDFPRDLAVDNEGNVWFTLAQSSRIGKYQIDSDHVSEYKTPSLNAYPMGISIDPYGHIWFTEYATGKIGRGDPAQMVQNTANGITEYDTPTANSCPYDIEADRGPDVGLGGRIWFTEWCGNRIGSWRANELAPTALFADDFSAGAAGWITDTAWSVVSETLRGTGAADFHAAINETLSWPDYTYQAHVRLEGGAGSSAGITFREIDADNHYRAEIGLDADGYGFARLAKVAGGNVITTTGFFTPSNADIVAGHPYTLRIEAREHLFRFYLGDQLIAIAEDDAFAGGRIGLRGHNATASFDDVTVTRYTYSVAGYFDEYTIPTEGSRPQELAVRYDGGDIWFTERGTHKLGSLVRQADSSPARLNYTLVITGTWGDDPNPDYKRAWQAYTSGAMAIYGDVLTGELAGLHDPNWESVERVAEFTIGGITYRDNGPNDRDGAPYSIIGPQSTAWHSLDTLYGVQQPILVPEAVIDLIWPSNVQPLPENPVSGSGHGTSRNGSDIIEWEWRSSRDGDLSTGSSFGPLPLSEGTHLLSFRVGVTDTLVNGVIWSPEAAARYRVNMRPIARFEMRGHGVQPDGSLYDVTEETLQLDGRGSYDPDGEVVAYQWRIDGNIISCTDPVCVIDDLTVGQHSISLRVQDNDGAWSLDPNLRRAHQNSAILSNDEPDYKAMEVTRTPVIVLYGYSFVPYIAGVMDPPWSHISNIAEHIDDISGYHFNNFVFPCGISPLLHTNPVKAGNVFLSNYSCAAAARGNLISYSENLAQEVKMARALTGADKVDLVAYSTGGNVARWYTRFIDNTHVRKLILIGSPNHGQAVTYWAKLGLAGVTGDWIKSPLLSNFLFGQAAAMQEPHSNFLKTLNGNGKVFVTDPGSDDQLAPGIDHYVILGNLADRPDYSKVLSIGKWEFSSCVEWDWDLSCKRIHKWVVWYPEFHTGDGGVGLFDVSFLWAPIMSASGSARLDNVPTYSEALHHLALQDDEVVREDVEQLLLGNTHLRSLDTVIPEEKSSLPAVWSVPALGYVTASEAFSYPLEIDSTTQSAHIRISSVEPHLSITLISPQGRLIQPENETPPISFMRYTKEEQTILEYAIEDPQPGVWHVVIAGNPIRTTAQSFQIAAVTETTVGLAVGLNTQEYTIDDPISIFAITRDVVSSTKPVTLTDGLVLARVTAPDGGVEAIHLYDDGTHGDTIPNDGMFFNTYTNTSQVGDYYVSVAGQFAYNGESLLRQTGARTEVQPDVKLALTRSYLGQRRVAKFGTTDAALSANQQTDLVAYIHNDGRDTARDILVHFYDGDPTAGGTFLGETTVDVPGRRTVAARLPWQATQGAHELFVVVDPYNFLMQRVEGGLEGALHAQMATTARTVVQDAIPPTADPGPVMTIPYDTPVRFDGLNSTDNVDVITYTWEIDLSAIGGGTVALDGPTPILVDGIPVTGTYPVHLTVYDAEGNADTASTELDVTATPLIELPNITNWGGAPAGTFSNLHTLTARMANDHLIVNEDEDVQFVAAADSTVFGTSSYNCEWTVDYDNAPYQNDLFGCRPVLEGGYREPGVYHAELRVSDMWGNGRSGEYISHRTITVTVNDITPPTLELPGINEDYWHIDPQLTITGTVTDNVAAISVVVNGLPLSITSGGVFSTVILLTEGVTEIEATAQDEAGNTTVVTRSVRYTAMDHFAVELLESNVVAGEPFSATVTAQYANDTTFPYTGVVRLDDTTGLLLPPQIDMVNGQWTGSLTLYAAQPVTITASARNRDGEQYVDAVAPAPLGHVVVSPASLTADLGEVAPFAAAGYDAYNNVITGNTTITWSVVNGGGVIDAQGIFTASTQPGLYADTVQATLEIDGALASGWATVRVVDSLRFTPSHSQTVQPGTAITYTHTLTNTGVITDSYQVTLSNTYPAWTTFQPFSTTLAAGQAVSLTLPLDIPSEAEGLTDVAVLTAVNLRTGNHESVTNTTQVAESKPKLPGMPTLLYPPDGFVTSTATITFTWTAGAGAAPTGYRLHLDDQVITTTKTIHTAILSSGTHTWTVQAYAEAGNSDWADMRTLAISESGVKVYLPLVIRIR